MASPVVALISLFLAAPSALAQTSSASMCINGANPKNTQLLKSIETNKDPLRMAYLATKKPETASAKKNDPNTCLETDLSKKQFKTAWQILEYFTGKKTEAAPEPKTSAKEAVKSSKEPRAALIKKECIQASMKRAPGNTGYTCDANNTPQSYGKASGETLQCFTEDTAEYLTFAVNKAIQCMSPATQPIDSRVLYRKFNNESGFNFSLAWAGGVSSPQLTTSGAGEVGHPTKGNGHHLLQEIIDSGNPACAPFKAIAQQDLKTSPLPIKQAKYCDWVSPGNGLARSLVYGIGLYLTQRDYYLIPAVEKRAPSLTKNRGVMNDLSAIAYGREGIDHAKWLLQKHRVDKKTSATVLRKKLQKDSEYLKEMSDKTREAACINRGIIPSSEKCEGLKLTQGQLDGDECVIK